MRGDPVQCITVGKSLGSVTGPRHGKGPLGFWHEPEGRETWGHGPETHAGGGGRIVVQDGTGKRAEPARTDLTVLQRGVRRCSSWDGRSIITSPVLGGGKGRHPEASCCTQGQLRSPPPCTGVLHPGRRVGRAAPRALGRAGGRWLGRAGRTAVVCRGSVVRDADRAPGQVFTPARLLKAQPQPAERMHTHAVQMGATSVPRGKAGAASTRPLPAHCCSTCGRCVLPHVQVLTLQNLATMLLHAYKSLLCQPFPEFLCSLPPPSGFIH